MSKMTEDPGRYFSALAPRGDALLAEMEREAAEEGIPIVGPVAGRLLEILAGISASRRILELGCATGYSAIHLARGCRAAGGMVRTVEQDPDMARRAEERFRAAGVRDSVEVLLGDAGEIAAVLDGPWDFIFLDIDKEGYRAVLPHCARLLRPGGLLVADNTAFAAAAPFVEAIEASREWRAVHLFCLLPGHSPERDALTVALRT